MKRPTCKNSTISLIDKVGAVNELLFRGFSSNQLQDLPDELFDLHQLKVWIVLCRISFCRIIFSLKICSVI